MYPYCIYIYISFPIYFFSPKFWLHYFFPIQIFRCSSVSYNIRLRTHSRRECSSSRGRGYTEECTQGKSELLARVFIYLARPCYGAAAMGLSSNGRTVFDDRADKKIASLSSVLFWLSPYIPAPLVQQYIDFLFSRERLQRAKREKERVQCVLRALACPSRALTI